MNKKLTLTHPQTPTELNELNNQLEELIAGSAFDEAQLLQLINQRDEIIQTYLKSLEKQQLQAFASAELAVNKLLVEHVSELQSESLGKLSSLIRGRKAVEKYK